MSFLLDDTDQSVMEAALSLVDEFAGDVVGAQDPITVSAPQASQEDCVQALVSKAQMAPREHINERKKMLRAAGVYGNSNHIDLEELKKQQGRDKTRARSRAAPSRAPAAQLPTAEALAAMNGPTMTTVWENIADSQRRRRKKAECENIRLKMVIEHQQKVADNLRSLIQKRASQLGAECSFFADVDYTNHHVLDLRGDVGEFQSLFRNLDNAYQEMDAVFALNGLNSMVVTRSDVQVRDGPGGKCVELFFNKVLPFKLQDAREAAWEHFRGSEKHMGNGSVYEKTAEDANAPYTILEDFTKEMHSNSARVDARMKQVVRRHVEPNRDVVIAVVSVNPAEVKNKRVSGLKYQVRSYAVTKWSAASTPEREVSQLQCCSLISFDEETEAKLGSDAIRALTNFLIVSLAAKMQWHQDCIENALMDHGLLAQQVS
ncbi:hypothetical protein PC119_g4790 [Phytophthora cactorum]|uniref:M96 mating-specific protein family n=1 Tax=Phytophthora cactorum TaxID=29920 RepID=A0A8T0ZKQ4_9STRA|nr:hypothetical protein PC113_g6274 [Phytophthora cactorum]KAG2937143.1 hypothetical protein PC115_g4399 [Phytophthora cactorum]KAG3034817.1 hypothetical protein PC119_g4790 [Phytophthora cactorum]